MHSDDCAGYSNLLEATLDLKILRGRRAVSGSRHGGTLTPACLHTLDVVEGTYRFVHPAVGERMLKPGEGFVVTPGTTYTVRIHGCERGVCRYCHLELTLAGAIDIGRLVEIPPLLGPPDAAAMGDCVQALDETIAVEAGRELEGALRRKRARTDFISILLASASLTERGRRVIAALPRLLPVFRHVDRHLGEDLTRGELAEVMGLSPGRFSVVFAEIMGIAPMAYVRRTRLERSQILLVFEGLSVTETAERLGFSDAFHFSKSFKQVFGESPTGFVARARGGQQEGGADQALKERV